MTNNVITPGTAYTFHTYERVNYCTAPRRAANGGYVIPRSAYDFPPCSWTCWSCHGNNTGTASIKHVEIIDRVEYFADNSVELVTVSGHRVTHVSPHGDAC